MEILETDIPAVRLLKAKTYLAAAGSLLKRVIFVVVGDVFRQSSWSSTENNYRNMPNLLMTYKLGISSQLNNTPEQA